MKQLYVLLYSKLVQMCQDYLVLLIHHVVRHPGQLVQLLVQRGEEEAQEGGRGCEDRPLQKGDRDWGQTTK